MDNYSEESFQQWLFAVVQKVRSQTRSISKESLEVFQPESFVEACTGLASLSIKGYTSSVLNKWLSMLLKQLSSPEIHKKLPYALDPDLFCPLQADPSTGLLASEDVIRRLPTCIICTRVATRFTINTNCKCIACYKCAKTHLLDSMVQAKGRTTAVPCFGCNGMLRNVTWSVAYYERLLNAKIQCHDSRCTFSGSIVEYCEHSLSVHRASNSLESHNTSVINSSFIDATQYEESSPNHQQAPYMFGAYGNEEPVVSLTTLSKMETCTPSQTLESEQLNALPQMIPMYSEGAIRHGKGKGGKRVKIDNIGEKGERKEKILPVEPPSNGIDVLSLPSEGQQSLVPQIPLPVSTAPCLNPPISSSLLPSEPLAQVTGLTPAMPPTQSASLTPPPSRETEKALKKKHVPIGALVMGFIVGAVVAQIALFFTNFGSIFPVGYNGIRYVNKIYIC
ncbi:Hypothetical protein GLP15_5125 [Giardia lamblia P15]|uniref:Uncharacterized protein n=1 Tax=Giardia intestinalis (strain P15) TaxID=658858 RepID=E1F843_GIAIA|nr:Hypothetical protein GLP15_5125 [Giardia lamblia P15]